MTTLPLAEVRDRLAALVDEVARTHDTVTITRNGVPTAVVVSADDYKSIMETLALVHDSADRERLAEAEASLTAGDLTTAEEMAELLRGRARGEPLDQRSVRTAGQNRNRGLGTPGRSPSRRTTPRR